MQKFFVNLCIVWTHMRQVVKPPVIVGALLGQMKMTKPQAEAAGKLLGLNEDQITAALRRRNSQPYTQANRGSRNKP